MLGAGARRRLAGGVRRVRRAVLVARGAARARRPAPPAPGAPVAARLAQARALLRRQLRYQHYIFFLLNRGILSQ